MSDYSLIPCPAPLDVDLVIAKARAILDGDTLERITTDLDVDDLLKSLDSPRCEVRVFSVARRVESLPCTRLATCLGILPCGHDPHYSCTECRAGVDKLLESGRTLVCTTCGARHDRVDWRPL